MKEVTISYSLADGILLTGSSRGDGSNVILKELRGGWRWSPTLGAWYVRGSRNTPVDPLLIDLTKAALEEVGFTVNVTGVTDAERLQLSAQAVHERVQSAVVNAFEPQPKITPLTVAQRTKPRTSTEAADRMQVHVRPNGEIVLDLGSGDSQTAVDFIRTLLQSKKTSDAGDRLEQFRQAPKKLGPREVLIWNYLRDNDSGEGVHVQDLREDLNLRDKQASGTLDRLQKKGFVTRVSFGRWRAVNG